MTAVDWLIEVINCDDYIKGMRDRNDIYEKAKKIEAEQGKAIPELSDKEINKASEKDDYFPVQSYAFIEGAKWYREQIKQRQ